MKPSKQQALAILATTILAAVIAYLTLTPPHPHMSDGLMSDRPYHIIASAALIFLGALPSRRSLPWLVPAALVFGGD